MPYSDKSDRIDPWIFPSSRIRRLIFSVSGLAGLVLLCAFISTTMWRSGEETAVAVAKYVMIFAAGMLCLLLVAIAPQMKTLHRRSPHLSSDKRGNFTIVPGSLAYFWPLQAMWLCYAAIFIPAACEITAAAWATHWHLALVFFGIGLFATIPVLASATGRLRPGRLILSPNEITYEGWSSRTRLRWNDVNRVRTSFEQVPIIDIAGMTGAQWSTSYYLPYPTIGGKPNPAWNLDRAPHTGWIILECPRFSVNRITLFEFLTFYAENPGSRVELGTEIALDRWRQLETGCSS